MQYPDIKPFNTTENLATQSAVTPRINPQASFGTQLVEAALVFAGQNKVKHIFAYSRPKSLRQQLADI
jgi:hypothetical protein